jgi:uncharacterized protein YdhG (YjbR/CyaY superfamily)
MKRNNLNIKTVPEYIEQFPKPIAAKLKALRKLIRENAKGADESISYGMPAYKLSKRPLVYFGGFANHVSLFATPSANVIFKKELAKYKTSKGTIQFPLDQALPLGLIRKIVRYRVKENLSKNK